MKIKLMYKIHCLNAAMGISRSAGNDTFYTTEDAALGAARRYVSYNSSPVMVIYKAHVLVRRNQPPVEVLSIDHDGETVKLR